MNNSGWFRWQVLKMLTGMVTTMASGFVVCVTKYPVGMSCPCPARSNVLPYSIRLQLFPDFWAVQLLLHLLYTPWSMFFVDQLLQLWWNFFWPKFIIILCPLFSVHFHGNHGGVKKKTPGWKPGSLPVLSHPSPIQQTIDHVSRRIIDKCYCRKS